MQLFNSELEKDVKDAIKNGLVTRLDDLKSLDALTSNLTIGKVNVVFKTEKDKREAILSLDTEVNDNYIKDWNSTVARYLAKDYNSKADIKHGLYKVVHCWKNGRPKKDVLIRWAYEMTDGYAAEMREKFPDLSEEEVMEKVDKVRTRFRESNFLNVKIEEYDYSIVKGVNPNECWNKREILVGSLEDYDVHEKEKNDLLELQKLEQKQISLTD